MIRATVVALMLFALTVATFWPVREFGFVNFDDPANVSRNPIVYEGLTLGNVKRAMTTSEPDYWRPLNWLSFMIDTEIYGASAKPTTHPRNPLEIPAADAHGYHLTNVILHGLGAVILMAALRALTGCFWRSALVAAIFAVHPLRVESVAWITERKDVLSGVFAFASLWAYARYGRGSLQMPRPAFNWSWMALATLFLGLGLMSKSTLVTLPFVFLLLDYWPLKRLDFSAGFASAVRRILWLVLEKTPMFIIVAASCWMTLQGGRRSIAEVPLKLRVANVAVSYVRYLGKTLWPADLSPYYPFPGSSGTDPWTRVQIIGSALLLACISATALLLIRKKPSMIVGWLWFVGMLVPVIGLMQVGNQGMADRFTYLPGIGLSVAVVWLLADLVRSQRAGSLVFTLLAAALLIGCVAATRHLLPVWSDTDSLYQRALNVDPRNRAVNFYYADYHFERGKSLGDQSRLLQSRDQLLSAAELEPLDAMPRFKLGFVYAELKDYYKAQQEFEAAVKLDPLHADAHFNIAVMLSRRGRPEAAHPYLQRALELKPDSAEYHELRKELTNSGGARTGSSP